MKDTKLEISQNKVAVNLSPLSPSLTTQVIAYDAVSKELGLISIAGDISKAYVDTQDASIHNFVIAERDALYAHVDDADAALQAAIDKEKNRIDNLVTGAPDALDTLGEIAAQLANDETGAAAILATQQQHTQQLANIATKYYVDSSDANPNALVYKANGKTFLTWDAGGDGGSPSGSFNLGNFSQSIKFTVGNCFWYNPSGNVKMLLDTGNNLNVLNQVIATSFVGDGSQLTNLPDSIYKLGGSLGCIQPVNGNHNANGQYSVIAGGYENATGDDFAIVGGGLVNTSNAMFAVNIGGAYNNVGGYSGSIIGGQANSVNGDYSSISGSINCTIDSADCHIFGSENCYINGGCSHIVLINCVGFDIDAGHNNQTYINNALYVATAEPTPVTADTLFWFAADSLLDGFGKNKVEGGANLQQPVDCVTQLNSINGLPVVLVDSSTSDTSALVYANQGPGTFTILLKPTGDLNTTKLTTILAYAYDEQFNINAPHFMQNSGIGEPLNIDNEFAIVTLQFTDSEKCYAFVNGIQKGRVSNNRDYFPGSTWGGHFQLFTNLKAEVAEILISRDGSREAGRLHETYLKQKYAL